MDVIQNKKYCPYMTPTALLKSYLFRKFPLCCSGLRIWLQQLWSLWKYKFELHPVQWVKDPAAQVADVAWIWSLAWEVPYAMGVAKKKVIYAKEKTLLTLQIRMCLATHPGVESWESWHTLKKREFEVGVGGGSVGIWERGERGQQVVTLHKWSGESWEPAG